MYWSQTERESWSLNFTSNEVRHPFRRVFAMIKHFRVWYASTTHVRHRPLTKLRHTENTIVRCRTPSVPRHRLQCESVFHAATALPLPPGTPHISLILQRCESQASYRPMRRPTSECDIRAPTFPRAPLAQASRPAAPSMRHHDERATDVPRSCMGAQ